SRITRPRPAHAPRRGPALRRRSSRRRNSDISDSRQQAPCRNLPMLNLQPLSRRQVLKTAGAGFGYLALAGMLGQSARAGGAGRPLAPRQPHFRARAKRIIFLFMEGAMSQMDTWEYKARLQRSDGQVGPGGGTLTAS